MTRACVGLGPLLLIGCLDPRARFALPTRAAPPGISDVPLSGGARITLDALELGFADLRLRADPIAARALPTPGVAHAHPGHGPEADVCGELLGAWTVDLLGGERALGPITVLEGPVSSAELRLHGPARLTGALVRADGARVPLDIELEPEVAVSGLPAPSPLRPPAGDRALVIGWDLAHALSFLDPAGLDPAAGDAAALDADGDGALTAADPAIAAAFTFGLSSLPTWQLRLESP